MSIKLLFIVTCFLLFHSISHGYSDPRYTDSGFKVSFSRNQLLHSIERSKNDTVKGIVLFQFVTPKNNPIPKLALYSHCSYSTQLTLTPTYEGLLRGNSLWSVMISKEILSSNKQGTAGIIISIDFAYKADTTKVLRLVEKGIYAGVINKKHIVSMNNEKDVKKSDLTLESGSEWMKPDSQYVRVTTKKDGLAKITGMQLLRHQPSWLNSTLQHLHLFLDGKKQRYAEINNDRNGKLDITDTLVFIGKRTIGDSTWNDLITDERSFFFMKNSSEQSKLYNWVEYSQADEEIETAEQEFHIEKNNWFHYGNWDGFEGIWNTEAKHGKGYYWVENATASPWDFLYHINKPLFSHTVLPKSYGEVDVQAVSNIGLGNYSQTINEKISFIVNGNSVVESSPEYQGKLIQTTNAAGTLAGVTAFGFLADTSRLFSLRLLPDYFHIKGVFSLEAFKGITPRLKIKSEDENYRLTITGFQGDKVIAIDSSSGEITTSKTSRGIKYSVTSRKDNGYKAISINDSVVHCAINRGWLLCRVDKEENITMSEEEGAAVQIINNTVAGSVLIITANEFRLLPNSVKQALLSTGFVLSNEEQNSYSEIIIKGSPEKKEISVGTFATIHGFLQSDFFTNRKAECILKHPQTIFAADIHTMESASDYRVSNNNLYDTKQGTESLIISHSLFMESAERLAQFRRAQGYSIKVVNVEDIYNQFGYGKKSPHTIKSFLLHAYKSWQSPRLSTVLLFGNASWDPLKLLHTSTQTDFIPTYGVPVSDFWYGLLEGNDIQTELIVGRLTPSSISDAENIVDKLIEYDTMAYEPWMKNFGSFAQVGGAEDFSYMFEIVEEAAINPPIGGNVIKRSTTSINGNVQLLRDVINNGVLWLNYAGHGATNYFGLDGWQEDNINNVGKYFLLGTHSCQTGAFGDPAIETRNESYVNSKKKGAIAATGDSGWGETSIAAEMMHNMYYGFANDSLRFLGELTYRAKWNFGGSYTFSAMQFSLVGDPLTRLRIETQPELFIRDADVKTLSQRNASDFTEEDTVMTFDVSVHNAGIVTSNNVKVRLIVNFDSDADTLVNTIDNIWARETTIFKVPISGKSGKCNYSIDVNYDSVIIEKLYNNNTIKGTFTIFSQNAIAFDPQMFWSVQSTNPRIRLLTKPGTKNTDIEIHILDTNKRIIAQTIMMSEDYSLVGDSLFIDWNPDINLMKNSNYYLSFRAKNRINLKESNWNEVLFNTFDFPQGKTNISISGIEGLKTLITDRTAFVKTIQNTDALTLLEEANSLKISACNGGSGIRFGQVYINGDGKMFLPSLQKSMVVHKKPYDSIFHIRSFDTYTASYEEGPYRTNTRDFYRYIRDSISDGEIVGVGFSDASFRGFLHAQENGVKDAINVDSLLFTLHNIGAQLIDSVFYGKFFPNGDLIQNEERFVISYATIGIKGKGEKLIEKFGKWSDTITVEVNAPTFFRNATVMSPYIGEAKSWDYISLLGENLDTNNVSISVLGYDNKNSPIGIVKEVKGSTVSLSDIDAKVVSGVQIIVDLHRINEVSIPIITSVNSQFTPLPEYAIVPSSLLFNSDELLRGDTLISSIKIRNLSLRAQADSGMLIVSYEPLSQNGAFVQTSLPIQKMLPDEIQTITSSIETTSLGSKTLERAEVKHVDYSEYLYGFNNSTGKEFSVREDKEPPTVEIRCDSVMVQDGDYIMPEPLMEFIIYDNSNLLIDSTRILIRINGRLMPVTGRTENAKYAVLRGMGQKRGIMSFLVKNTFEKGDNNVRIIAEDGSGNKDTVTIKLWVASDNIVELMNVYPNPTSSSSTLDFDVKTLETGIPFNVKIYDQRGRVVRTIADIARLGENSVQFNGKDDVGNDLPTGMYMFIVEFYGITFTQPAMGNLIIVR